MVICYQCLEDSLERIAEIFWLQVDVDFEDSKGRVNRKQKAASSEQQERHGDRFEA